MSDSLIVRVNDELVLEAGTVAFAGEGATRERIISPPTVTMFEQLLAYLDTKTLSAPAPVPRGNQEGVVAAALCLRWGSYFAVLADQSKPLWRPARKAALEGISRISDAEMARINIEASAAIAALVDIFRLDRHRFDELVAKTLAWIPLPQKKVSAEKQTFFFALSLPEARQMLSAQEMAAPLDANLAEHTSRLFGNALVNFAWRNGPVEDIHAGEVPLDLPLNLCRISSGEVRDLVRNSAARFQVGFNACWQFCGEPPETEWSAQVWPYTQAAMFSITPSDWSLTETSREIRETVT